ncbi:MAG: hypothetical protein HYX33_01880 [Actinobacteria bacterium]|nr:hypothetical protein [Actinomycetota bacterium]
MPRQRFHPEPPIVDAALAGLPRLVRISPEIRRRGVAALGLAVAAAAYWVLEWLVDQPVAAGRTLAALAVSGPISLVAAIMLSRHRLRAGRETQPPPRLAVYETRADGRDRHIRALTLVLLGAVSLLVFDRMTNGGGTMVGLIVGLALAMGIVDVFESRRWESRDRDGDLRLYVRIPATAMLAGYAPGPVYGLPRDRDDAIPSDAWSDTRALPR